MSTSILYHGFKVRGYTYLRTEYKKGEVIFHIKKSKKTGPVLYIFTFFLLKYSHETSKINYEGAFHHGMNCGINGEDIFE